MLPPRVIWAAQITLAHRGACEDARMRRKLVA